MSELLKQLEARFIAATSASHEHRNKVSMLVSEAARKAGEEEQRKHTSAYEKVERELEAARAEFWAERIRVAQARPIIGKRVRRATRYRHNVPEYKYGVVEVYEAKPGQLGASRSSLYSIQPGDLIVRMEKGDGSPGLRVDRYEYAISSNPLWEEA